VRRVFALLWAAAAARGGTGGLTRVELGAVLARNSGGGGGLSGGLGGSVRLGSIGGSFRLGRSGSGVGGEVNGAAEAGALAKLLAAAAPLLAVSPGGGGALTLANPAVAAAVAAAHGGLGHGGGVQFDPRLTSFCPQVDHRLTQ